VVRDGSRTQTPGSRSLGAGAQESERTSETWIGGRIPANDSDKGYNISFNDSIYGPVARIVRCRSNVNTGEYVWSLKGFGLVSPKQVGGGNQRVGFEFVKSPLQDAPRSGGQTISLKARPSEEEDTAHLRLYLLDRDRRLTLRGTPLTLPFRKSSRTR
jgi:hypothetical protein